MAECILCHRADGKRACPLKANRKICARCCQLHQLNCADCPAACQFLKTAGRAQPVAVVSSAPTGLQRYLDSAPMRIKRRYGTIARRETDDYLDVLQNLEAGIVYAANRDERIADVEVMQALRALMVIYEAQDQGQTPSLPPLAEPVQSVVDQIQHVIQMRAEAVAPIPVPVLLRCLRRLFESATLWNERMGRHGYLDFIQDYVMVENTNEPLQLIVSDKEDGRAWTPEEQARYLTNRGSDLLKAGRLDEATLALEKAHRLEPGNASIAINLSAAYIQTGKAQDAVQLLESVRSNRSDDYAALMVNLGGAYLAVGREEDAFRTWRRLAETNPQMAGAPTFYQLGRMCYDLGDTQQALIYLRRGRKLDPEMDEINELIEEIGSR